MTATRCRPETSCSAVKSRPRCGVARSIGIRPDEIIRPCSVSGPVSENTVRFAPWNAARSSNDVCCARQS
jgi:hypothetical protein